MKDSLSVKMNGIHEAINWNQTAAVKSMLKDTLQLSAKEETFKKLLQMADFSTVYENGIT